MLAATPADTAVQRFDEWRLILRKSFPTKWQRKKSSHVRARGHCGHYSGWGERFPKELSHQRCYQHALAQHSQAPALSPRASQALQCPRCCPQQGSPFWPPTLAGENPHGWERRSWGQEWRQHLDEKRKLQNPWLEWWVKESSYSWVVSLDISALRKKCIKMYFSLWDGKSSCVDTWEYIKRYFERKTIYWPKWNICTYYKRDRTF